MKKSVKLQELKDVSKLFQVLYVEDELDIKNTMLKYLNKFFLKVVSASNGEEGLKKYKKEKFDIVITDLSMPRMNGLKMLQEIKTINDSQAILITSAHSESEYMVNAIKLGVDGYIIKPFDYEQLNYELFKTTQKLKKFAENEEYKKHLKHMVEQKTAELSSLINFQKDNYDKTLFSMVEMIEDRDTYTAGHSQRVAYYSKLIAKEMGHAESECEKIYQAGILHDIGKVATPDVVLLKPQQLNDLEYKLIKEHVDVGNKLLVNIPMFKDLAEIVHSHHERYDGMGYPRGLEKDEIVPLARIMIVADSFDAMTTNRIYKARKTIEEALDELKSLKYQQFHSEVVDSALVVLQNIQLDENINQLPHTEIEEERFAYFYKDILCNVYNKNYLDLLLMKNNLEFQLKYLYIVSMKKFGRYNHKYGWTNGDEMLKKIAESLQVRFETSYIFRIFGDDFVLLSLEAYSFHDIDEAIGSVTNNHLEYKIKIVDLGSLNIELQRIEQIITE